MVQIRTGEQIPHHELREEHLSRLQLRETKKHKISPRARYSVWFKERWRARRLQQVCGRIDLVAALEQMMHYGHVDGGT
jgi:hypothetical protein